MFAELGAVPSGKKPCIITSESSCRLKRKSLCMTLKRGSTALRFVADKALVTFTDPSAEPEAANGWYGEAERDC